MFCGHMDKNYVLNCLVEKNNNSKAKLRNGFSKLDWKWKYKEENLEFHENASLCQSISATQF